MSVLVLWSSPNQDGLTASAARQVAAGLAAGGAEVEELCLNRYTIEHCRACGNGWGPCRAEGRCVIDDDFAALYDKLAAAQGIVFVTAVYWHDCTEQFKALLDRLRRCETMNRHALRGKNCLLLACAGGTGNGAVRCLFNLEETMRHMELVPLDRTPVIRFNKDYILPALEGAGRAFAARIAEQAKA